MLCASTSHATSQSLRWLAPLVAPLANLIGSLRRLERWMAPGSHRAVSLRWLAPLARFVAGSRSVRLALWLTLRWVSAGSLRCLTPLTQSIGSIHWLAPLVRSLGSLRWLASVAHSVCSLRCSLRWACSEKQPPCRLAPCLTPLEPCTCHGHSTSTVISRWTQAIQISSARSAAYRGAADVEMH